MIVRIKSKESLMSFVFVRISGILLRKVLKKLIHVKLRLELERVKVVSFISIIVLLSFVFFENQTTDNVKVIELNKTKNFTHENFLNVSKICRNSNDGIKGIALNYSFYFTHKIEIHFSKLIQAFAYSV